MFNAILFSENAVLVLANIKIIMYNLTVNCKNNRLKKDVGQRII